MRRLGPVLRCKYTRCTTATRTLLPAILAICITVAASWKLLLEVHNAASFDNEHRTSARQETSVPIFHDLSVDQAPEAAELRASGEVANSDAPQPKSYFSKPGLSRERFNAALAAGLIDPSKFGLVENSSPREPGNGTRDIAQGTEGEYSEPGSQDGIRRPARDRGCRNVDGVCRSQFNQADRSSFFSRGRDGQNCLRHATTICRGRRQNARSQPSERLDLEE
jgi:hypothetical protein